MSDQALQSFNPQSIVLMSPEMRQQLYERAKEIRNKKTPKEQIKQKGGFDYAEYAYMLDEMDRAHPVRSEIITSEDFNEKYLIFRIAVRVTDLATGESRSGVSLHPVIAYDSKSDGGGQKDIATIRELMDNAYKAALTKALRHAYSNWGVAADLYKTYLAGECTKEQKERFYELDKFMEEKVFPQKPKAELWWTQIKDEWSKQNEDTADAYLNSLDTQITNIKGSLK